jgi:hypothetical protein
MNVSRLDPAPVVVGTLMALSAALFLVGPYVDPLSVGGETIPVAAVSFVALAVALDAGAVLFYFQGARSAALAHGVAGSGWTLLVVGPLLGSGLLLVLGLAVVIGGAVFLVVTVRSETL